MTTHFGCSFIKLFVPALPEPATGGNAVDDWGSCYVWSFSGDPMSALKIGKLLSSRSFQVNKQLQII